MSLTAKQMLVLHIVVTALAAGIAGVMTGSAWAAAMSGLTAFVFISFAGAMVALWTAKD